MARQDLMKDGWTKAPQVSQSVSSDEEQSSQSEESEKESDGDHRHAPQRPKERDPTMQVFLKIVDTMQIMQKSMPKSK